MDRAVAVVVAQRDDGADGLGGLLVLRHDAFGAGLAGREPQPTSAVGIVIQAGLSAACGFRCVALRSSGCET